MRGSKFILVMSVFVLFGCFPRGAIHDKYYMLTSLSDIDAISEFKKLPVNEKVDVYLYGVLYRKPSDYFFSNAFNLSNSVEVSELIIRLNNSQSATETFALIYALHGVNALTLEKLQLNKFDPVHSCNKFFKDPSPCHQLAYDIKLK